MREHRTQLENLDIRVKIITFDSEDLAKTYVHQSQLPWPLLLDQDYQLYSAYGFPRGNLWTLCNPVAILKYLKLMLSGTRPGKPGKDLKQLGGNVLVDPDGIVRLHYKSQNPLDRPTVPSILQAVQTL